MAGEIMAKRALKRFIQVNNVDNRKNGWLQLISLTNNRTHLPDICDGEEPLCDYVVGHEAHDEAQDPGYREGDGGE